MSALLKAAMGVGAEEKLYVDDVFSTYLYTGNSSTQTITNGIDLAGKGGLVWTKSRGSAVDHAFYDTARGNNFLSSSTTTGQSAPSISGMSFSASGYNLLGADGNLNNTSFNPYASWTFRKAPKFFDVVTYMGDGTNRTIAHSLGQPPGMVVVKQTSASGQNWVVWHRSAPSGGADARSVAGYLNLTDAVNGKGTYFWSGSFESVTVTDTAFGIGNDQSTNTYGTTYVAYLFAHDTTADGLIQCGSFTTDGSGNATVNLGWEPQYLLYKSSSAVSNWQILDTMRGMPNPLGSKTLNPNLSSGESGGDGIYPTATGFMGNAITATTYIYLAIRRPNKPPTSGTQVYNAIARTGTGAAATVTGVGFAPDSVLCGERSNIGYGKNAWDRLRGAGNYIRTHLASSEANDPATLVSFNMDGMSIGTAGIINSASGTYIDWCFRRAPGFFDVVCWTGDGTVGRQVPHSLGVKPELAIHKARSATTAWPVACLYIEGQYTTPNLLLNTEGDGVTANYGVGCKVGTTTTFYVDEKTSYMNVAGTKYVTYLFATKAGISKVGSYTGNGTSQTIPCGFTTGARFVLIKRTDSTGDWFVWDTVRGISASTDPHLSLNTTAVEVTTDDSIDADTSGFIVNQLAATNINVTSATYIFLAIA